MASIAGARGEITLGKELRDKLGIGPGWQTVQRRVGSGIEVHSMSPRHQRSLEGVLANVEGPHFPTDDARRDATERARSAAASENESAGVCCTRVGTAVGTGEVGHHAHLEDE